MGKLATAARSMAHWAMTRAEGAGVWVKSVGRYNTPAHYPWDWWQKNKPWGGGSADFSKFGPVHSCVSIISQDLSRIPLRHTRVAENGHREVVTNSALSRIIRKPNHYQTRSDFILYLAHSLLYHGNAYAVVGGYNGRGEIESLYPLNPKMIHPYLAPDSPDYVYRIGADDTSKLADIDTAQGWLPPRQVIHIRLFTPVHPLVGESPLVAATEPTIAGQQINRHNASFFSNMSRPSGVLKHPGRLKEDAMQRIKQRWNEITAGGASGETAVLSEGMDWTQLQMTAVDAEMQASYKLSERQIFQIFRVPTFLGGETDQSSTLSNVETLTRFYLQSCLGFYVDHLEEAFADFFDLPPEDSVVFDLEAALLRGDLKERMEGYAKAIQNAVYTPDEARAREGLPPVEYGDQARVQQQLVTLEYGANLQPPGQEQSQPASDEEVADVIEMSLRRSLM